MIKREALECLLRNCQVASCAIMFALALPSFVDTFHHMVRLKAGPRTHRAAICTHCDAARSSACASWLLRADPRLPSDPRLPGCSSDGARVMRGPADGASLPVRRITHELRTLSSSSADGAVLPRD